MEGWLPVAVGPVVDPHHRFVHRSRSLWPLWWSRGGVRDAVTSAVQPAGRTDTWQSLAKSGAGVRVSDDLSRRSGQSVSSMRLAATRTNSLSLMLSADAGQGEAVRPAGDRCFHRDRGSHAWPPFQVSSDKAPRFPPRVGQSSDALRRALSPGRGRAGGEEDDRFAPDHRALLAASDVLRDRGVETAAAWKRRLAGCACGRSDGARDDAGARAWHRAAARRGRPTYLGGRQRSR